jgi:hypothetical protein
MTLRKHKRKMFFPVGLLSLAIIQLIFFHQIKTNPIFHQQYYSEINLPRNAVHYFKPLSGKWKRFSFSEDDSFNRSQLANLRQEVKLFMKRVDTIQGIQIMLNRQMTYNRFITIVDMLNMENVTRYSFGISNIWVHKFPCRILTANEYPFYYLTCGGVHFIGNDIPLTWSQHAKQMIQQYYLYFHDAIQQLPIPVIFVWLLMLFLNIYKIRYNLLAT